MASLGSLRLDTIPENETVDYGGFVVSRVTHDDIDRYVLSPKRSREMSPFKQPECARQMFCCEACAFFKFLFGSLFFFQENARKSNDILPQLPDIEQISRVVAMVLHEMEEMRACKAEVQSLHKEVDEIKRKTSRRGRPRKTSSSSNSDL